MERDDVCPGRTPEEAKREIERIMGEYPHLTRDQACLLMIYRGTAKATMRIQNSNGGGTYPAYCLQIGVPY